MYLTWRLDAGLYPVNIMILNQKKQKNWPIWPTNKTQIENKMVLNKRSRKIDIAQVYYS